MTINIANPIPYFVAKLRKALGEEDLVEGFTTAGGTAIPAGTLQETLEAIADLADPAA